MIPKTAFRVLVSLPIAWFAGNVVFAILADGTWLTAPLQAILKPSVFDVLVLAALWITRVGVFIALLVGWVFADGDTVSPATAGDTRVRRDKRLARGR